jgi:LPXTG-motif cell wall-anchored protein
VNRTPFPSSRRRLRRLAVLAGGLVLGATAVLTIASPASAHHPTVNGECARKNNDGWVVTWTVTNSESDLTGTVTDVKPAAVGDIKVDAVLPKSGDGQLKGEQAFGLDVKEVTLEVTVKWIRDGQRIVKSDDATVKITECKDESPSPSPSVSSPAPSQSVPASEAPSPAPGAGGGGPTLPTTGAATGTAVAIAAVLLAAGTGLFFFFRRRRIRFTA